MWLVTSNKSYYAKGAAQDLYSPAAYTLANYTAYTAFTAYTLATHGFAKHCWGAGILLHMIFCQVRSSESWP
jgi:hypothetical protein